MVRERGWHHRSGGESSNHGVGLRDYDAFISYSHEADEILAPQLQRGLERLGKPWWRRRPFISVFRDETSFGAGSDLEGAIEGALDESSHLIMLLSPEAAASPWVNEEAKHWADTKGVESMSFAVTRWGAPGASLASFRWDGPDVPPALRGRLHEPLAIDMRWAAGATDLTLDNPQFEGDIAMLAAAVKGINRDQLVGEMVAMRTRARIVTGSLILAALILLGAIAASGTGWLLARNQQASAEAAAAQADQDRGAAESLRDEANLAAAEATQLKKNAETAADEAESLRLDAVAARAAAETAATQAEEASKEAAGAAAQAARDRDDALLAQSDAEGLAAEAGAAQAQAESATAAAEAARSAAQEAAASAALLQVQAEAAADLAEAAATEANLVATSRRLAGQALERMSSDLDLATLLAIEANRVSPTVEAKGAILTSLQTSPGLGSLVHAVESPDEIALSPDGGRLVAASSNQLMIWDDPTDPTPAVIQGIFATEALPDGIAFAATGDVLAFGRTLGGEILLYDVAARDFLWTQGGEVKTLKGANADVSVVGSLDPSEPGLLASSQDLDAIGFVAAVNSDVFPIHEVLVWTITQSCLTLQEDCTSRVFGTGTESSANIAELSLDGTMVATRWQDDAVRVWDVSSGAEIATLPTGPPNDGAAVFHPESQLLAVASGDALQLWDIATGLLDRPGMSFGDADITSLSANPDGTMIAAGNADSEVGIWDLSTGTLVGAVNKMSGGPILSLAFTPDGSSVWANTFDTAIHRWEVAPLPVAGVAFNVDPDAADFALSPDGSRIAVPTPHTENEYGLELRDTGTGDVIRSVASGHSNTIVAIDYSPDGDVIATGSHDASIRLWGSGTLSEIGDVMEAHWAGDFGSLNTLAFDPTRPAPAARLASGGGDGTVKIWDIATQSETAEYSVEGISRGVHAIAISPDGSILADAGPFDLQLWDLATGQPIGDPIQAAGSMSDVTFSPDGTRVAASTFSNGIVVWDVATQDILVRFGGGSSNVAFSSDGGLIAADVDVVVDNVPLGRVALWDAATGRGVGLPFAAHDDFTADVEFSPDGSALYSLGGGTLLRTDMRTTTWIDLACKRVNRNLTPDEWAVFLPGEEYRATCG